MPVPRPRRRHSVVTRSMSNSSFVSLMECHNKCFDDLIMQCSKESKPHPPVALRRVNTSTSTTGCVIKRHGVTQQKIACRRQRAPIARIDSMQKLFDGMELHEDSAGELCDYRRLRSEISSHHKYPARGKCECSDNDGNANDSQITRQISWIRPTTVCLEEASGVLGPYRCRVCNPLTGMGWRANGTLVEAGEPSSDLYHWRLISNEISGYMFGFSTRLGWRYATVVGNNRIKFRSHSDSPDQVDIERQPTTDARVFYYRTSSDGGYLIPGNRPNYFVTIAANRGRQFIEISDNLRQARTWRIDSV